MKTLVGNKHGEERYDILFPEYKKGGYIVRKVAVDPTKYEVTNAVTSNQKFCTFQITYTLSFKKLRNSAKMEVLELKIVAYLNP